LEGILKNQNEALIINGDADEFIISWWGDVGAAYSEILGMEYELAHQGRLWRVLGNHDWDAVPARHWIPFLVPCLEFMFGDMRCVAIHGHQFDKYWNKGIPLWLRFGGRVVGAVEKVIGSNFDDRMLQWWFQSNREKAVKDYENEMPYWSDISDWAFKLNRYDYAFCGHSHIAGIKRIQLFGKTYVIGNSGTCVKNPDLIQMMDVLTARLISGKEIQLFLGQMDRL
jgi:predicted phosphodiesterase